MSSLCFAHYLSLPPACPYLTHAFSALHPLISNALMVLYYNRYNVQASNYTIQVPLGRSLGLPLQTQLFSCP